MDGVRHPETMKHPVLCLACIAILPLAGCSHTHDGADLKAGTGRGTFVSARGDAVTAIYSKVGDTWDHATVRLLFPGKTPVELSVAMSGSGARYTNETAQWWEHQGEATYDVGGTNVFRGRWVAPK